MRFEGKVALITGGASGIGAAAVRRFASEGARVMIGDLTLAAGLCDEVGPDRVACRICDVSQRNDVDLLVHACVEQFGRLDVLFNNAGIGGGGSTTQVSIETWHRTMAVNLDSMFYACRAAIPQMRAVGGGAIVNTGSLSGLAGDYGNAAYNASKGAVVNYTRALAMDHAVDGIRANVVCPGLVDTPIVAQLKKDPELWRACTEDVPLARAARPEEIAAAVAFLASDDASFITGIALPIDGGRSNHTGFPNLARLIKRHE
jgi:meso-butanediol dehydrogenase/(S,S)-butanediol dehydrogenase/diacetyl reductase